MKNKVPDNNPCSYKMVSHCYYQDTARQLNQQQCTNCILARVEKHLFSVASQGNGNKPFKKVARELANGLQNRETVSGEGLQ